MHGFSKLSSSLLALVESSLLSADALGKSALLSGSALVVEETAFAISWTPNDFMSASVWEESTEILFSAALFGVEAKEVKLGGHTGIEDD